MAEIYFSGQRVSEPDQPFVIAEIGHNHQGNLETAIELFKKAHACGAHAVKLQKRNNRLLYTKKLYDQPYDNENSYGATYGEHREALEFGDSEYKELQHCARDLGLIFFATAFDFDSVDFLEKLNMPLYKIASGDLKNTPLLKHIATLRKPMIISTGGGTLDDIKRAYDTIMPINQQLCILQCTASYPTKPEEMNLRVISTLKQEFPDLVVGLSDHQSGIAMSVVAYVLGARVFEKHFTLNRAMRGTDHAFSLEPAGLEKMVRDLSRARLALGDGIKNQLPVEEKPLLKMGKKLVAALDIKQGAIIDPKHIAIKSPGDGLPPFYFDSILGKRISKPLSKDDDFNFDDLLDG